MVLAKAFAVGIVTGLLAPVVVVVASLVTGLVTLFVGGFAATGGGASSGGPSSFDVYVPTTFGLPSSSGLLLTQIIAGFGIGFLLMLWRALVRRQAQ